MIKMYSCDFPQSNPNSDSTAVGEKIANMKKMNDRIIKVTFSADTHTSLQWNFKPLQTEVKVAPGETALAFYTATNPMDEPVVGISTYTVLPFEAGKYFHKLQCFCFEEQTLEPKEEVSQKAQQNSRMRINNYDEC